MRLVDIRIPPKKMLAKARYLNGVKISLRKITANIRVKTGERCHKGITLDASSIDKAFRYTITPSVRKIPAAKAANKCQNGIEGMPTNINKIALKIMPGIPKKAVNAIESLRYLVLNALSSTLDQAHMKVAINARKAHNITL